MEAAGTRRETTTTRERKGGRGVDILLGCVCWGSNRKDAIYKSHDTSTNSTVESGQVGTSSCMCHRVTTVVFFFISIV